MPYSPNASFNYTPMTIPQIQGAANPMGTQGLEFARWAAGQGLDLANLVRGDRNAQLAVQNAFQQQQADRALAQQEFQNRLQKQREAQALADARQQAWQDSITSQFGSPESRWARTYAALPQKNFQRTLVSNITGAPYEQWEPTPSFLTNLQAILPRKT